jgi:hypothetical protein
MHGSPARARLDGKRLIGRIALAFIFAYAAVAWSVSASFLWIPRGTLGITANYDGDIQGVNVGSPAAAAGIAPGDRIVIAATPPVSRPKVIGVTEGYPPGDRVTLTVERGGVARRVVLIAAAQTLSPADVTAALSALVATAIFIVVGTVLILFSPSRVTWGFGLFCLFSNPVIPALSRFPSPAWHLIYIFTYDVLQNVGVVGLLVFALNFPHAVERPWRALVARALPFVFVVYAGWTVWIDFAVNIVGTGAHVSNVLLQIAFGVYEAVAIVLITETYLVGPLTDRPRLRWVLVGFYVGLVCNYVGNVFLYTANVTVPIWCENLLIAAIATLPLTVGYAIVRHRVIEIDFFVGRAIVYAIFTTALVFIFGLVDWLLSRVLEDFRLSLLLNAMVSIGAAYAMDAVHGRLERAIDAVLFRGRQLARERLERLARALRYVTSPDALEHELVGESHAALALASVALFRQNGAGYRRVAAFGWPEGSREELDADDRLVLEHRATNGPIALQDLPWSEDGVPRGVAAPLVSVPLSTPRELTGLLLCSGTAHGEALDPEEVRWIEHAATVAAYTYEEIDGERLRDAEKRLRAEVEVLTARLDEARRRVEPAG